MQINHPVSNPNTHYISNVEIQINATLILVENYLSQPSENEDIYNYKITANSHERVEVTATCIQGGSFTVCLIISVG